MLTVCLAACGGEGGKKGKHERATPHVAGPDFQYTSADIIGPVAPAAAKLPVDIYLDATLSMKGFSRPQTTNFSRLLEGIEATVQDAAKSSDLRFFKYGRSVAPLPRADFVAARHSQALWEDKGFRSDTDFAQAVDSTDPGRVSIFITDLFYSNADANKVVAAIKDKCFKQGVEMGMMGLKSDYDGYVADVQPPVKVTGARALYLVVFGSKANINLIFSAFKNQPYVQADQLLLLTRYPVKSFKAEATKARDSKAINVSSARNAYKDLGNVFAFNWNPGKGEQGTVDYTITYEAEPYTLPVSAANLRAHVFRKDKAARDSVADDQSLTLRPGAVGNGKIAGQATASLKLPANNDYVAYQLTWQYDNLGRVELPAWITANSTADFNQASSAAAKLKTLGLDDFVRSLAVSSATQFEPKYGRLYLIFIRK
ncbi:hypothetical protein A0257_15285 [Hymenobacter psoromatis]|nr:hypothetical protein A0257_15285 [Hymenobacter psoromatis]